MTRSLNRTKARTTEMSGWELSVSHCPDCGGPTEVWVTKLSVGFTNKKIGPQRCRSEKCGWRLEAPEKPLKVPGESAKKKQTYIEGTAPKPKLKHRP